MCTPKQDHNIPGSADRVSTEEEDKAITHFEQGKLRRAEGEFQQMLSVDPNNITAHFYLARIYRRTEEFERALRHGRRVLRLNPEECNAYLNVGLIYEAMKRCKLAVAYYKRELAQNPFSGESLFNLGFLYFERHRWQQAAKHLAECFKIGFPFRREDTVHNLGACYNKLGDIQSYIDLYQRYLEGVPTAGWAAANLGSALLHAKDYRGAVLKLTRARQLGTRVCVDEKLALAKRLYREKGGREICSLLGHEGGEQGKCIPKARKTRPRKRISTKASF